MTTAAVRFPPYTSKYLPDSEMSQPQKTIKFKTATDSRNQSLKIKTNKFMRMFNKNVILDFYTILKKIITGVPDKRFLYLRCINTVPR
jgi:hypothetical protein